MWRCASRDIHWSELWCPSHPLHSGCIPPTAGVGISNGWELESVVAVFVCSCVELVTLRLCHRQSFIIRASIQVITHHVSLSLGSSLYPPEPTDYSPERIFPRTYVLCVLCPWVLQYVPWVLCSPDSLFSWFSVLLSSTVCSLGLCSLGAFLPEAHVL